MQFQFPPVVYCPVSVEENCACPCVAAGSAEAETETLTQMVGGSGTSHPEEENRMP